MRHAWLAVVFAAVPACAQVAAAPLNILPDAARQAVAAARAQTALAPAPVDPKPVSVLFDRLAKDGAQMQTQDGVEDAYSRLGILDKNGHKQNLQVGVVEVKDPNALAAAASGQPQYQDLVVRRYFTTLEAQSEDWSAAPDGTGRIDLWHFTVTADGLLVSVDHDVIPLKPDATGKAQPDNSAARAYRASPSDPAVRARWNALTKKLLTLGRTLSA